MSIKKGRKGRRLHISTERKPNVITMLGHKYDRTTLAPYGKVKNGSVHKAVVVRTKQGVFRKG